jgi:uncharacterized membrane protein
MMPMDVRNATHGKRYWEIDALRGVAIVTMVLFHIVFDLSYFGILPAEARWGVWRLVALCTASTFVLLVGLSLSISYARTSQAQKGHDLYAKYIRRGMVIFGYGLLITTVSYLFLGEGWIIFGILHLIGISIILSPIFFRYRALNFFLGYAIIMTGLFLVPLVEGPLWLAWLGFHPATFVSVDYEPLLPWLGVVLIGYYAGTVLYPGGVPRFRIPGGNALPSRLLSYLGERSLFIYLLHQPVIIGVLAVLGRLPV